MTLNLILPNSEFILFVKFHLGERKLGIGKMLILNYISGLNAFVFWYLLVTFLVTLTWYGYETAKNGTWFIAEFIQYQYRLFSTHDAGQEGFPGYHYVVILLGCFPASVLALPSFFRKTQEKPPEKDFRIWMIILFFQGNS